MFVVIKEVMGHLRQAGTIPLSLKNGDRGLVLLRRTCGGTNVWGSVTQRHEHCPKDKHDVGWKVL